MSHRILLLVSVIGVIIVLGLALSNRSDKNENSVLSAPIENQPAFEPMTSSDGGVEIIVRPTNLSSGSPTWSFEVSLSTHSVELSEDMVAVSKLVLDSGETLNPLAWEGDPPGGHHRGGILTFAAAPTTLPLSVTLKILKIGGVPEREFKWNIK
ncbi:MAG: hypothetical protein G01um101420_869 [Parcubacteria group bacterium Gr01-1014_20]|nr:MAG: hypothetical protein G01um101420_869 [Parcubacteria group bacterium Gr01-1014_20]